MALSEDGFDIIGGSSPAFRAYPRLERIPAGFEYAGEDNGFHIYRCSAEKKREPSVDYALVSEANGVKRYRADIFDMPACEECYVKLGYGGNKARLYIDGRLADDDYRTGEGWTTGLARYGFPKSFEVEIYPLYKSDRIYFENAPVFDGDTLCRINSAEAVCEYVTKVAF